MSNFMQSTAQKPACDSNVIKSSLKTRFIFCVTLILFITMTLVVIIAINRERQLIIESVVQKASIIVKTIAKIAANTPSNDVSQLTDISNIALTDSNINSITIKKVYGFFDEKRGTETLISFSDPKKKNTIVKDYFEEQTIFVEDIYKIEYYFILGDSASLYVPIKFKDNMNGQVWIVFSLENAQKEINSMLLQNLIITILVTCFGGLVSIFLAQVVLDPLSVLVKSIIALQNGQYSRIEVKGNDEVSYLSSTFNDLLNQLEKKEEIDTKMQRLDKLSTIGQLSAGIAHEIKNPLTSIRSLCELIKSDETVSDENKKSISVVISEVDRLNKVTNEFFSLAKPKDKKYEFFDINVVIKNIILLLSAHFKRYGIKINMNLHSKINVYGDSDDMAQVILNILINSIQAFEDVKGERKILINTYDLDNYSNVEIIDNGCGIDRNNISKIFMPFFTGKKKGTGLGLSIVKRLLDEMNAGVEVTSEVNNGTAFKISMPVKSVYKKSFNFGKVK